MSNNTEWIEIATVQGELRANVIKALLEDNSIPVILRFKSGIRVYPISIGSLGEIKILVPRFFAEKARELIKPDEEAGSDDGDGSPTDRLNIDQTTKEG